MIEPDSQDQALDLQAIIAALLRRVWTVTIVLVLCLVGTGAFVFTAKPVFLASSLILIEKEEKGRVYSETTVSEAKADDYYQTQYRLLKSRSMLKRVCESLNLADHPEFGSVDALSEAVSIVPVSRSRLVNINVQSF
ncbi:MAG: Wzz/FepE/Etk N-terminal domain-containing protein, partial [Elusimicrobiota bacterium]